jgi:acyl-CoA synthetase (NDP forming)
MSPSDHAELRRLAAVPTLLYPEDAARSLGKVVRHVRWREAARGEAPALADARADEAAAVLSGTLAAGREWLDPASCARLLGCYGIAMPASRTVTSAEAAAAAAAEIGGAVALKAAGPEILHKTELGAVELGLTGAEQVRAAAEAMDAGLAARGLRRETFMVQAMIPEGVELLVGVATDPVFGPVLVCGAGGTSVELLGDVRVRVCPLSAGDPAEMLGALAIKPLLDGYRGSPPADIGALESLLLRVSAMVEAHPEIGELDLNPVLATPAGAIAVDARVKLAPVPPPRPWPRTWTSP